MLTDVRSETVAKIGVTALMNLMLEAFWPQGGGHNLELGGVTVSLSPDGPRKFVFLKLECFLRTAVASPPTPPTPLPGRAHAHLFFINDEARPLLQCRTTISSIALESRVRRHSS